MLDPAGLDRARPPAAGSVRAVLRFAHGAGRTFIQRQIIPYPFHITRPHVLDPDRSALATLILQSAAGGLYRGDRLVLDVSAGSRALAHVTSQAATVVHAVRGQAIGVETRLDAASGAVLAVTTDPYILFPGTSLSVRTEITLAPGASVIVAEGFATHDPAGGGRAFDRLSTRSRIGRPDGTCLVDEGGAIDGTDFDGPGSPLGPYRAMGTVMVLGAAASNLDPGRLEAGLDRLDVLAGVTTLPNRAGLCVRLLALEGGRLARGLHAMTRAGLEAALGHPLPARRP